MIIGIDFDNTIVCYDTLFYKIALKKGIISKDTPPIKDEIRNYLRKSDKENIWTELQGYVYGPGIVNAKPFKGIFDFFRYCKQRNILVYIISHKTRYPFLGSKYELHKYAHQWLSKQGFYDSRKAGLSRNNVFFELTKEAKLHRIAQQNCTHYIDDLPEFLSEQNFPSGVIRILFDPNSKYKSINEFENATSWHEIIKKIKGK